MTLDKSVYKLGDTIKVHVEASVKGGSSDVDKITGIYRYYIHSQVNLIPSFVYFKKVIAIFILKSLLIKGFQFHSNDLFQLCLSKKVCIFAIWDLKTNNVKRNYSYSLKPLTMKMLTLENVRSTILS